MKFYTPIPLKPFPSYYSLELLDKKIPVVSYAKVRRNCGARNYLCVLRYIITVVV